MDEVAIESLLAQYWWLLLAVALWTIPWKGVALWKAARNSDRLWFVVLLVINDLGLLEILYIFMWSKRSDRAYVEKRKGEAV